MRTLLVTVFAPFLAAGCGGSQQGADAPTGAEPAPASETPADAPSDAPADAPGDTTARPKLTAAQCEANGGSVIGDIGDGAVHRPDYRCANGAEPTGTIVAAEGGPIAVEGSVCCPK